MQIVHRRLAGLLAGGLCCLLSWGCGLHERIHQSVSLEMASLIDRETALWPPEKSASSSTTAVRITFSQALCRALKGSSELQALKLSYQRTGIEAAQARSQKLPRVTAEVSSEVPIGAEAGNAEENLEAGLFLTYDLLEAVFSEDAVAAEKIRGLQQNLRVKEAVQKIYHQLMRLLIQIDFRSRESNIWREALSNSRKALARAEQLGTYSRDGANTANRWERLVLEHETALRDAEAALEINWYRVRQLVKIRSGGKVDIVDWEALMADTTPPSKAPVDDPLGVIWRRRPDIQRQKLDLELAELAFAAAKRSGWPRLRASVGVGHVLTDFGDDTAPLVPMASLSMPLFDMGDAERTVARARNDSDLAKARLVTGVRTAADEYRSALLRLKHARRRRELAARRLALSTRQVDHAKHLLAAKRMDPMDAYHRQIEAARVKVTDLQSVSDLRIAVLALDAALGKPDPQQLAVLLGRPPAADGNVGPAPDIGCPCALWDDEGSRLLDEVVK